MSKTEEYRNQLTEDAIRSLNTGVVPWQRSGLPIQAPQSATSGKKYGGINAVSLLMQHGERGFTDPRWMPHSDLEKQGLKILPGEKSVHLEHWSKSDDGKLKVHSYPVFNMQQLTDAPPLKESELTPNDEKAYAMLKEAGIEMPPGSGHKDYQEAFKTLAANTAEKTGLLKDVHTADLKALRVNIAATFLMQEAGLPVEQDPTAPARDWGRSIRRNPKELFTATRDAAKIQNAILKELVKDRGQGTEHETHDSRNACCRPGANEAESLKADALKKEAQEELSQAQAAQEKISDIKGHVQGQRGTDMNLSGTNLNPVEESVLNAADKGSQEVAGLRNSAADKQSAAKSMGRVEMMAEGKKLLGKNAIVTDPQVGATYKGKVMMKSDTQALVQLSQNQGVILDIKDHAKRDALEVGGEISAKKEKDGSLSLKDSRELKKEREEKSLSREGMER